MNSYTKGPWAVQKAEDCMGRKLDDMVGWVVTAEDHDLWISTGPTWDPEHSEESEANARLIAAAPDLVIELRQAIIQMEMAAECIENGRYDEALLHVSSLMRSKKEVVAKATGESS